MLPLLAMMLLTAGVLGAQDWSGVQALHKGDRIGVIQANQKRVEGRFESATDSRITLEGISLEKADVVRVYQPARHGRVFGAVVGGAIGVACGGIADGTLGQYLRNEQGGPSKGAMTAAGAGVGVGIGVAVTGGYRTVYRRAK
jgi:hypothetical protein